MTEDVSVPARGGPILNVPWPAMLVVAACAAVHIVRLLLNQDQYLYTDLVFGFVPALFSGSYRSSLPGQEVWSFLSYAFLHGDWLHLLFNSLWLVVFGSVVARRLGATRFFVHAAIAAIAGAFATLVLHWGEEIAMIGASGAVSGQLAAAIPLMYGDGLSPSTAMRSDLSHIKPLGVRALWRNSRALIFIAIWFAITLLTGVTGMVTPGESQAIAWEAHLGGFIGGLFAFYLLDRRALDG